MGNAYSIFLDDERYPSEKNPLPYETRIFRTGEEALDYIKRNGPPLFISFDHDLGDGVMNGYDFAKELVRLDLDSEKTFLPEGFDFQVHSQNPIGARNIIMYLQQYLKG